MVSKTTKKKVVKTVKRQPNPAAVLKKVASVSDSNKALQKEIKVMSKIFGENQKVLVSMKGMIDTLTSTLEHIQKQSKQINIIEDDTQKLYAGLNQVRTQSNLINKINNQTEKLENELKQIADVQKTSKPLEISQKVEESMNSITNNSQMIIKIAQRIDEVRDDLREVSGKANSFSEISSEMNKLKESIEEISGKTENISTGTQVVESLKQEFEKIIEGIAATSSLNAELEAIKITIDTVSERASKIDSLGGVIEGLKQEFETVSASTKSSDSISLESIKELGGKIDKIETEIGSLSQRADSTAFVGENLKLVQEDFSKVDFPKLRVCLGHRDMRIRQKAQFELVERGEKGYDVFVDVLRNSGYTLARIHSMWGIAQLARNGDKEKAKIFINFLKDKDLEICAQAAKMLGDVKYKPAVPILIAALKNLDPRVQMFCAEALGRIEEPNAVIPILQMLEKDEGKDTWLRAAGMIALGRIGRASPLFALVDSDSKSQRTIAVVALRKMGNPVIAEFLNEVPKSERLSPTSLMIPST
mgnify:CR=1 FL=1